MKGKENYEEKKRNEKKDIYMHLHKNRLFAKAPDKCRILSNRSPSTRKANEYIAYILVDFNLPISQHPVTATRD